MAPPFCGIPLSNLDPSSRRGALYGAPDRNSSKWPRSENKVSKQGLKQCPPPGEPEETGHLNVWWLRDGPWNRQGGHWGRTKEIQAPFRLHLTPTCQPQFGDRAVRRRGWWQDLLRHVRVLEGVRELSVLSPPRFSVSNLSRK